MQLYDNNNVFAEKIDADILRSEDLNDKFVFFVENFGDAKNQPNESFNNGQGRQTLGTGRESVGTRTVRNIKNY